MNEFELIAALSTSLPTNATVIAGVGDDCAVLDSGRTGHALLFKADAVVEGIHFLPSTPPESVGHKALARALSDIAAMAGRPVAALVTLALPKNFDPDYIQKVYNGMNALAARHGVAIVGGETTSNPERLLISVALLGDVAVSKCIYRTGAKDGDALFVTGELGGSLAGKHLDFEPRLAEAQWLAEHFAIHSMIDLSDGLAGDLRHLMCAASVGADRLAGRGSGRAEGTTSSAERLGRSLALPRAGLSGLGAELLVRSIPISRAAKLQARSGASAKPALVAALTDGEDFELLFTIAARDAVPLVDAWHKQFPKIKLSCIGKMTASPGLKLRDENGVRSFEGHGYVHFA